MTDPEWQPSWRKPVGMIAICLFILVWVVLIASFATTLATLPMWLQLLIYVFFGLVWIWIAPLKPLLRWMETGRWRG
ncbi:DUF2842 domain-containing protein [Stakelama tenebrarum]|uniref:DUF2842 domain-containing protein n=1 Tax=Stakelama tenebrarum TaxID=2711215 RepID=A0A6G6Y6F8_9SPHN|nr:DUF2842 domain-containing protein [Sphingosinithalassobacter tenebrarum]QIG80534.1 DUF2842 domain-containing protein [Sphingosinithalassobacter tenebrarum]